MPAVNSRLHVPAGISHNKANMLSCTKEMKKLHCTIIREAHYYAPSVTSCFDTAQVRSLFYLCSDRRLQRPGAWRTVAWGKPLTVAQALAFTDTPIESKL